MSFSYIYGVLLMLMMWMGTVGGMVLFMRRRRNGNPMRPLRQDPRADVGPATTEHEPRHLGPEAELAIL